MEALLSKVTGHLVNYAIRTGIGVTASFAISQSSRFLKTVDNNDDYEELCDLQERFREKLMPLSQAIDIVDMISARSNSTVESASALARNLRKDILAYGTRIDKAATAQESSQRTKSSPQSRAAFKAEVRQVIKDLKSLLIRMDSAVSIINLVINTSGAKLSSKIPTSISPSRLLQASTILTFADAQYVQNTDLFAQVGPTLTLSLYMLFAGHTSRATSLRDLTWKEVMHKAKVRLLRVPLGRTSIDSIIDQEQSHHPILQSFEETPERQFITGEGREREYAYLLEIIEDLDDHRVHSFEAGEPQPGPCGDVQLAGIRELMPVHQVSSLHYADTGKVLNINTEGETINPVLLVKRNNKATHPRQMEDDVQSTASWQAPPDDFCDNFENESQDDIDRQLRRESSVHRAEESYESEAYIPEPETTYPWKLPSGLDPEWLAFEIYTEPEVDSDSEDDQEPEDDSVSALSRPSPSPEDQSEVDLAAGLTDLHLEPKSSPPPFTYQRQVQKAPLQDTTYSPHAPSVPVRSSLSLLEMLIRLTILQQVHQTSHLSVPDEFLNYFLEESTVPGDDDQRNNTRMEIRHKVGFDPYDESPIKHRGEEHQRGQNNEKAGRSKEYDQGYEDACNRFGSPGLREGSVPRDAGESWLLTRDNSSSRPGSPALSSPIQPSRQQVKRSTRPLDKIQYGRGSVMKGSPLGRGMSVETDSTLGTSPLSPTLVNRVDRVDGVEDGGG